MGLSRRRRRHRALICGGATAVIQRAAVGTHSASTRLLQLMTAAALGRLKRSPNSIMASEVTDCYWLCEVGERMVQKWSKHLRGYFFRPLFRRHVVLLQGAAKGKRGSTLLSFLSSRISLQTRAKKNSLSSHLGNVLRKLVVGHSGSCGEKCRLDI